MILVPTIYSDGAAQKALRTEGVTYTTIFCHDIYQYSKAIRSHWNQELIIVEHDVAPWPGALTLMQLCSRPWCVHTYPFAPNAMRWAMGCVRFSASLVQTNPNLVDCLDGVTWNQVDGTLIPKVIEVAGQPHIHYPPVAHLK